MSFGGGFSFHGRPSPHEGGGGAMPPGFSDVPKTSLELTVSASGLKDKDTFSKSDPQCILFIQDRKTKQYAEMGRTEKIENTLDPQWKSTFTVEYRFEEKQLLKFVIIDSDSNSTDIKDHDNLGFVEVSLGEIVSGQSRGFTKPLKSGSGSIRIFSQELGGQNKLYTFNFSAKNLDNKDFFGKSDPYLEIHRLANGTIIGPLVHRTEYLCNNLNPQWKPFQLEGRKLNNNNEKEVLIFTVYDHDNDGTHELIGSVQTSLEEMTNNQSRNFPLINEKKKQKKGSKYKDSGTLVLNSVTMEKFYSFLDFIQAGLQMNVSFAIDFTASNGAPRDPRSLHHIQHGADNQYTLALRSVGEIIQDYDFDKQFPVLGFGARIPPSGQVAHDFFVTLDQQNPYCTGIPGVLAAYQNCINQVTLYGPTNFSPVIEHVATFARTYSQMPNPSNYFVLLIITDGIITDMEDTKRSIIAASSLPMSIIIVGVGDEDFDAMEELDSDDRNRRLSSGVQQAERDIVQFVELRRFAANGVWNKEALAQCVLAELPGQVLAYMKKLGYKPDSA